MNAFAHQKLVEARSHAILSPLLEEQSTGLVWTSKGRLSKLLQEQCGDAFLNDQAGDLWTVEVKAERRFTGNLFLETWSNRNLDLSADHAERGSRVGWLPKLRADLVLFHFLDRQVVCVVRLFALQQWAFGHHNVPGKIYGYPEKVQRVVDQPNDTWGRCVPISVLERERLARLVDLRQTDFLDDRPLLFGVGQ